MAFNFNVGIVILNYNKRYRVCQFQLDSPLSSQLCPRAALRKDKANRYVPKRRKFRDYRSDINFLHNIP